MPKGTQRINGTDYVYDYTSVWNSEKQRSEQKRVYIGKNVNGVFIPNKSYALTQKLQEVRQEKKTGPVPVLECKRQFYGATYLLDEIGKKLGVTEDLKSCFPDTYQQILSLVYFTILEEGLPFYRFAKWSYSHRHPWGENIPSQRSSELLGAITEEKKMNFFRRQSKRRSEQEYLAFDTTSISSYAEMIRQVKYGKNKEGDALPQINLALLYGQSSRLPVYYRKLAGNIPDVKTIDHLIKDIGFLEIEKLNLVMDRGFYSERNINELFRKHHKFLIGLKTSLRFVKQRLESIRPDFAERSHFNSRLQLYVQSFTEKWDYREEKPRTKEPIEGKRRIYVHYYYNDQHATDNRNRLNRLLDRLEEELRSGKRNPEHEKLYAKYYDIRETPARGIRIEPKEGAIREAQKNFGYFVLMSNSIKNPVEALEIYRLKDVIEKSFNNLKERLGMRRMQVHSEENLEGKLFLQFVALIYLSYLKKQMDEQHLFKNYTMQELLDELDVIEYYQQPGKWHHLSEMTEQQKQFYAYMDVEPPA